MASVGPASGSQISVEMLKRAAKVDMTFVPFPGYSPAINALLGNHLTAVFADYSVIAEQYKAGKVRVLAVGSAQRMRAMPDVPTIAEFGFKDYEAEVWYGLFAPVHTPRGRHCAIHRLVQGRLARAGGRTKAGQPRSSAECDMRRRFRRVRSQAI